MQLGVPRIYGLNFLADGSGTALHALSRGSVPLVVSHPMDGSANNVVSLGGRANTIADLRTYVPDVEFYEILWFDAALSDSQFLATFLELRTKYGLTV